MSSRTEQNFACTNCGQIYVSVMVCCCPFCRSGVVNQHSVSDLEHFNSKSYLHYGNLDAYRSKVKSENPELFPVYHDQNESIAAFSESPVIIDWAAFTFKLADLRHCSKSGMFSGIPFPEPPIFQPLTVGPSNDIDAIKDFFKTMYTDYLGNVMRVFIQRVLGFSYGGLRGKGFNFYDDSFSLLSDDGSEFCGQVGIGGNNDTVHFSINGSGCKHLFANRSREFVHHWLANILGVVVFTRIDLACDDFDGVHTSHAAEYVCSMGGFQRARGFSPKVSNKDEFSWKDSKKIYSQEMTCFGSRQSLVYWRIYNKKLERKIEKDDFEWYRSEVELKKFTVDVLLDPVGYFSGLNDYSASLLHIKVQPIKAKIKSKIRAAADILKSCVHAKKQYGQLINSLVSFYEGNLEKVVSSLIRGDSLSSFPSMHQKLINSLE